MPLMPVGSRRVRNTSSSARSSRTPARSSIVSGGGPSGSAGPKSGPEASSNGVTASTVVARQAEHRPFRAAAYDRRRSSGARIEVPTGVRPDLPKGGGPHAARLRARAAGEVRPARAHLRRRPADPGRVGRRPGRGRHQHPADPPHPAGRPAAVQRDGHGHRGADGDRHGPRRRHRRAAPQPRRRGPGRPGRPGEAVRGRHGHQPGHLLARRHPRRGRRAVAAATGSPALPWSTPTASSSASSPTATCASRPTSTGSSATS